METEPENAGSSTAIWVSLGIILLPVIYILSIGPVIAVVEQTKLPSKPFELFYLPVIWLHDHTPLEKPLERYAKWWGWQ